MKKLLFIFIILNASLAFADIQAMCKKGGEIRKLKGMHCNNPAIAAWARSYCQGTSDFEGSDCDKNIKRLENLIKKECKGGIYTTCLKHFPALKILIDYRSDKPLPFNGLEDSLTAIKKATQKRYGSLYR